MEKTSLNVKFFDWDYLYLTALMKETYFNKYDFQSDKKIYSNCDDFARIASFPMFSILVSVTY